MRCFYLLLALAVMALPVGGAAQTIDDFESGDIAAWNVEAPFYTALSVVTPGAGGSARALSVQEIAGSAGGHSAYALAHRVFASPANWTAYSTLELDAAISAGEWNGYSIRVYNDNASVWVHGLQSDASVPGFRALKFDISGIARDKITEIVVYVNRTSQNAGQALTLDNIRLTNNPVTTDPVRVIENFSSGDISKWTAGGTTAAPHCSLALASENAPSDPSSPARAIAATLSSNSSSALFRWNPAQTMDWTDYKTLEFDAKLAVGTVTDGFSVRIYNAVLPARIKKFVPGTGSYATWQVDISGVDRDQVNEVLFYLNRTLAYDPAASPARPMTLRVDNLRLTKNAVAAGPNVVYLQDFDLGIFNEWNWPYSAYPSLNADAATGPWALDLMLTSETSTSAYCRETFVLNGAPTQDWEDYKSLMFEAKVVPGPNQPNYPIGFSANVVNGGTFQSGAGTVGPGGGNLWFYPSGYDTWETHALDLTAMDVDQVSVMRWYVNRCNRADYSMLTGTGQVLRLDSIRISKEPAPPSNVSNPNIDDFEDGDIADWYYVQQSTNPDTGEVLPGVSRALTSDAASGSKALVITCNTPPGSTSAYTRKTLHADWTGYKTLEFDAKVADSRTSQGFSVLLRHFSGYAANRHEFYPTNEWQTFMVDISKDKVGTTTTDARAEVISLLFYVNQVTGWGSEQDGAQKLYLDNIRLTNDDPITTSFASTGGVKSADTGTVVTLTGAVSTGSFQNMAPDKNVPATLRTIFFVEDLDRSSAIPVVIGGAVTGVTDVPAGSKVDITGILTAGPGLRYIYATSISTPVPGFAIPDPVVLINKNAGAEGIGLDQPLPGFAGADTTGMLAEVTGKILGVGTDGAGRTYMYIDDGSAVAADNGAVGLKVFDWTATTAVAGNVGKHVRVTGFVMTEGEISGTTATWKPYRAIWPKADLPSPIILVN